MSIRKCNASNEQTRFRPMLLVETVAVSILNFGSIIIVWFYVFTQFQAQHLAGMRHSVFRSILSFLRELSIAAVGTVGHTRSGFEGSRFKEGARFCTTVPKIVGPIFDEIGCQPVFGQSLVVYF